MSCSSREEARLLIGRIREDNGGISPEDRAVCPPAILRALENVRRKLGSATKTLATNLYSKDTRFVYELIQNAEDNHYSIAGTAGEELYLRFNMYPDRIVLESNEDGFNESNVKAICSTGESTKTVAQGYIGEKGIGFKSVFKVAKKVYIQSGPFAFSFEHTRDSTDDGLGMVTPIDEEYVELPRGVTTRMTLMLLDPSTFQQRVQELANIPDTLLLFLSKLEKLCINVFVPDSSSIAIEITRKSDRRGSETITKTRTTNGVSNGEPQIFRVVKRVINNLPPDEARIHTNQATVALAFPVDNHDNPIIKQQHVFAFLPLRRVGFTFLIQSDFITQASREDVFHSVRNEALLSAVAETFRDAVLNFCTHPTLRYRWMRYLPADSISDEFWTKLRPQIISLLTDTACIWSWSGSSLRLPSQLYRLVDKFKDKHEGPLFADISPESYMSPRYTNPDFTCLKSIGSSVMTYQIFISTVEADLKRNSSKMKTIHDIDEDWHSRAASTLSSALQLRSERERILKLDLIPLQDEYWVSAKSSKIHMPGTGKSAIPPDLNFNLVHSVAAKNSTRENLFLSLGVQVASVDQIISRIIAKYKGKPIARTANITHLLWLYWNLPQKETDLDKIITLFDQTSSVTTRSLDRISHIYFMQVEEEYGAWNLLRSISIEEDSVFTFLHKSYLDAMSPKATHNGRTWEEWLGQFAGVQAYPQLIKLGTTNILSDEFKFIMFCRPEMLVGLLMYNWSSYEPQVHGVLRDELKLCKVPSDGNLADNLGSTFLPLPRLTSIVSELKIRTFPFLKVPKEITKDIDDEWKFLKRFGVKGFTTADDLHFYTQALRRITLENVNLCSSEVTMALVEVYSAIERNSSTTENALYVSELFRSQRRIYIPEGFGRIQSWTTSGSCVWKAPPWLQSKVCLERIPLLLERQHLFKVILKIKDADWNDYLADLRILKAKENIDTERVMDIYERLWREFKHDSSGEVLRKIFEELKLVFVPANKTWHPPSVCIWAENEIQIPGKVSIQTQYENLADFFCKNLCVPKPDLTMHIQALEDLSKIRPQPLASQLKNMIKLISSMGPTTEDVAQLRSANIFSVSTIAGNTRVVNTTSEWAIIDRSEYGTAFTGKLSMLDYSLEDVRSCSKLLLALDLGRRHLSELVEEKTTVNGGSFDNKLSQLLRTKACALFRCAVHFQSQKARHDDMSLYNQLLGVSINVSDGISKSISVLQSGKIITIENSRANFHLDERNGELRLYVPRDEDSCEECFFRQLPRSLMRFIGISNPAAEALLTAIIGCRSLVSVDSILKDAGIVEVDGISRPSEALITNNTPATESLPEKVVDVGKYTAPELSTPESVIELDPTPRRVFNTGSQWDARRNTGTSRQPFAPPREHDSESDREDITPSPFLNLLERVIHTSSSISIPQNGSNAFAEIQGDFHPRIVLPGARFGPRSPDRDRKIGAAGELLIFEMLSELYLLGFSIANWKSTIRNEVSVHKKYSNLAAWPGRETADITYDDVEGKFTQLLIDNEYLDEDFVGSRSRYYLEVKTTSSDCDEQFYMSKAQYKRMETMKLSSEDSKPAGIYVIFRVFDIGGKIGFRLFVDPDHHRKNGELLFTAESWAVKPVVI